ncbi:molybdenum cofactor sulfurase [Sporothrix schenckii 1099-18]|uniref:Molybdenum cofactor sulfurase n=1 Tax=Sporothrix schenckii 1099-18 TaxID=1397361 RepID=A0A0F2MFU8_SPOSC|nr:molybdenum cofactor sulfurase [Sporothrix schenckii 1099-18]KJR87735.1 molybdenum cofactor sulfurase [Sporothrix schenckii 1099-18]
MSILDAYPEYGSTACLDTLRQTDYSYLDEQHHVYLDYTGSGLAARSQHRAHAERQTSLVLGNPHSVSPTSECATALVEATRTQILEHFGASPDEYAVVFTANATGAARLVGEAYRWGPTTTSTRNRPRTGTGTATATGTGIRSGRRGRAERRLVLTADNHNSIHGLREYARRQGVATQYVPCRMPDMDVDETVLMDVLAPEAGPTASLRRTSKPKSNAWQRFLRSVFCGLLDGKADMDEKDVEVEDDGVGDITITTNSTTTASSSFDHPHDRGLFAYPAQSNFSGVRHSLDWIAAAQRRGYDVLLDAAAYLPTSRLDLSRVHPDFVLVSWYKLFGYPTGVGCLVARREALARLDRPWFSGGTIQAVSVGLHWHAPAHRIEAQFEDGTVNFQSIPDVGVGIQWLNNAARAGGTAIACGGGGSDDAKRGEDTQGNTQMVTPADRLALVSVRVRCLTGWFLDRLVVLRHSNGRPMVRLYGPPHCLPDGSNRGGTVTFNVLNTAGVVVDERIVAREAAKARISLRTGCFCNPGAGEAALQYTWADMLKLQALAMRSVGGETLPALSSAAVAGPAAHVARDWTRPDSGYEDGTVTQASSSEVEVGEEEEEAASSPQPSSVPTPSTASASTAKNNSDWPVTGAVRVSFGIASNTADVDAFFVFVRRVFGDWAGDNSGMEPRIEC